MIFPEVATFSWTAVFISAAIVVLVLYPATFLLLRRRAIARTILHENVERMEKGRGKAARYTLDEWKEEQSAIPVFRRVGGLADFLAVGLLVVVLAPMLIAASMFAYFQTVNDLSAQRDKLIPAVETRYGVPLTENQAQSLLLPPGSGSKSSFVFLGHQRATDYQLFGSTILRVEGEAELIHLAWVDGKYVLLVDGSEDYAELTTNRKVMK